LLDGILARLECVAVPCIINDKPALVFMWKRARGGFNISLTSVSTRNQRQREKPASARETNANMTYQREEQLPICWV
jgi:hypothetical protein